MDAGTRQERAPFDWCRAATCLLTANTSGGYLDGEGGGRVVTIAARSLGDVGGLIVWRIADGGFVGGLIGEGGG